MKIHCITAKNRHQLAPIILRKQREGLKRHGRVVGIGGAVVQMMRGEVEVIRKTVKNYKRMVPSFTHKNAGKHCEEVLREIWWFLFIPVYSREHILKSTI